MNKLRRFAAALTLGLLVTATPALAQADDVDLGDTAAVSGLFWDDEGGTLFVSDADSPGAVLMVDDTGGSLGEVTFSGQPEAVEGLALAEGQLFVADIGDDQAEREYVTVFGMTPADGQQSYRAWDFAFPEGPQDGAAFLVSGRGRFYFITTGSDPGIYRAGLEPSRDGVNELVRAADAPEGVTDATFLDDGQTMLVRSAAGVELINAFTWETEASTTYVGAPEGESITQFGEGRMLVGAGGILRDEPLPDGETTVTPGPVAPEPEPSPTPDGSPEPADSSTPAPEEPQEGESGVSRSGTLIALAGAVLVAVLAGAIVFVSRD